MQKRSPRYPRHNLSKCLEMVKKLFGGAHQSKVDVDTAARVIGYANSSSGAAASALGALRQFGLVDGLRGDMRVSELAMRMIQPMNEKERVDALREAAAKPEIFGRILAQFNEKLPHSDEPVKAFLIRQEGFSASGASELIGALRETMASLPEKREEFFAAEEQLTSSETTLSADVAEKPALQFSEEVLREEANGELISLPLGSNCRAEIRFLGEVTANSYSRLIKHLDLLRDMLIEDRDA